MQFINNVEVVGNVANMALVFLSFFLKDSDGKLIKDVCQKSGACCRAVWYDSRVGGRK